MVRKTSHKYSFSEGKERMGFLGFGDICVWGGGVEYGGLGINTKNEVFEATQ